MDNDVFRYVLGSKDEMSNCILKNLISMIIKKNVLNVNVKESEPVKDNSDEKGVRMDMVVECVDANGRK